MAPTTTDTLRVPGADLYHEIRGSGPVLLLICGGVYDAAGYAGLAEQLAGRYTVLTYDRRGNSRSPLDAVREPQSIDVHGDDAHRLLTAVGARGDEPAYVFGNSSGAIIGLELAARHPEQVRTLVAHEPPLFELLPDRDRFRVVVRSVEETFVEKGSEAAGQVLTAGLPMSGGRQENGGKERIPGGEEAPQGEPDKELTGMMARLEKNMEFFLGYEVRPFATYSPDLAALRASATRIVTAVGEDSDGEPPSRAALALAERLGTRAVVFPGDHGGFGMATEAFAARLDEVLEVSR
jgi:pimeloyl-ACP methyl ester carboxylesterase